MLLRHFSELLDFITPEVFSLHLSSFALSCFSLYPLIDNILMFLTCIGCTFGYEGQLGRNFGGGSLSHEKNLDASALFQSVLMPLILCVAVYGLFCRGPPLK